jgi:hypothetical protein
MLIFRGFKMPANKDGSTVIWHVKAYLSILGKPYKGLHRFSASLSSCEISSYEISSGDML